MRFCRAGLVLAFTFILSSAAVAQSWTHVGPPGGDVRSLVRDPQDASVLYLGTADGHVFTSRDGARHWRLLGRVGTQGTVVHTMMVDRRDSSVLFAGTWSLGRGKGGAWRSVDGGQTWKPAGMEGQTVRSIVQAPSDNKLFFAATLDGVYRSCDDGANWQRISPVGHADLRNFDSLAVDPRDPNVIYAGTYHLAWKTTDGGGHWSPIHAGMIDDSDVMSIVLDRGDSDRVFATACSGMYRSSEAGERWAKIQGIPFAARRTQFIQQDPANPHLFYAGTTQGLWKSTDGTVTWTRITRSNWSIIGLVIDPLNPARLVVGLERRGIVVSEDGGRTYRASNDGFHHQQTFLFALDPAQPKRMLVVLTNSADPVQLTEDGGQNWRSLGVGLKPELTHSIHAAPGEWWATLHGGGLLRYDEKRGRWLATGTLEPVKRAARAKGRKTAPRLAPFKEQVLDMEFTEAAWYAATARGLYVSMDRGRSWKSLPMRQQKTVEIVSVRASTTGGRIAALSPAGLFLSTDTGQTWTRQSLPEDLRGPLRLHQSADTLILASDSGLFLSRDEGATWTPAKVWGLQVEGFVAVDETFFVSTNQGLHVSHDRGDSWSRVPDVHAEARFPFLVRLGDSETILAASSTESLHTLASSASATSTVAAAGAPAAAGSAKGQPNRPRQP